MSHYPARDPQGTAPAEPVTRRTLAELRAELIDRLGFIAHKPATTAGKTLGTVRAELIARLGFIAPNAVQAGKSLAQLRDYLLARLGFGAQQANPPPGVLPLLDAIANEAQDTLWRRYAQQVTPGAAPVALVNPSDPLTLDNRAVEMLALALAKAHFGQPDAQAAANLFEAYLQELLQRQPPGLVATLNSLINDAQAEVWRRLGYDSQGAAAPPALVNDGDPLTIDAAAVEGLALARAASLYGRPYAKDYLDRVETYLVEQLRRQPPGLVPTLDSCLRDAQDALHEAFEWPELVKWYTVTTVAGQALYTTFTSVGTDVPNPHRIIEAKIEADGTFYPLRYGIEGSKYTVDTPTLPNRYEFRAGLELWPLPDRSDYTVHVKAVSKLHRFTQDSDPVTLPHRLVFLDALARAKAHFRQDDALAIAREAELMRRRLASRAHGTARYVPGDPVPDPLPQPVRV